MPPLRAIFGGLMVAGAALDAAALTLLGLFLMLEGQEARGGQRLPPFADLLVNLSASSDPSSGALPAALAGAAFVYLMVRIVLGLLTGAVSLFSAAGRFRS